MNPSKDNVWNAEVENIDSVKKAKAKLILDFGLNRPGPERVTIEVLRQLIKDKPDRMCQTARRWLHNHHPES